MTPDPSKMFRPAYRDLSARECHYIAAVKDCATQLASEIMETPHTRERALALTKLEESVMWAVKSVTG